jgi:hypothetical protein
VVGTGKGSEIAKTGNGEFVYVRGEALSSVHKSTSLRLLNGGHQLK